MLQTTSYKELKDNLDFDLTTFPNLDKYIRDTFTQSGEIVALGEPKAPSFIEEYENFPYKLIGELHIEPERNRGACVVSREEILADEDTEHIKYLLPEGSEWFLRLATRTGGGNWDDYFISNIDMQNHDNHVYDYDDSFDSTYHYFLFDLPQKMVEEHLELHKKMNSEEAKNYFEQKRRWKKASLILCKSETTSWLSYFKNTLKNISCDNNIDDKRISKAFLNELDNIDKKPIYNAFRIVECVNSDENQKVIADIENLLKQADAVTNHGKTSFDFDVDAQELVQKLDKLYQLIMESYFVNLASSYIPMIVEESRKIANQNKAIEDISKSDFSWKDDVISLLTKNNYYKMKNSERTACVSSKFKFMMTKYSEKENIMNKAQQHFKETLKKIDDTIA